MRKWEEKTCIDFIPAGETPTATGAFMIGDGLEGSATKQVGWMGLGSQTVIEFQNVIDGDKFIVSMGGKETTQIPIELKPDEVTRAIERGRLTTSRVDVTKEGNAKYTFDIGYQGALPDLDVVLKPAQRASSGEVKQLARTIAVQPTTRWNSVAFDNPADPSCYTHELGHVIGLYHTHQHALASSYVAVKSEYAALPSDWRAKFASGDRGTSRKIKDILQYMKMSNSDQISQIDIPGTTATDKANAFYGSVMMYRPESKKMDMAFGWSSSALKTEQKKAFTDMIRNTNALSELDVKAVNDAYGCKPISMSIEGISDSTKSIYMNEKQMVSQLLKKYYNQYGTKTDGFDVVYTSKSERTLDDVNAKLEDLKRTSDSFKLRRRSLL